MVEPREQFFQDLLSAVDQQMDTVKNDIKDIMKEKRLLWYHSKTL